MAAVVVKTSLSMEKPLDEGSSSLPEQPTREKTATERIVSIAVNFFMIIPFYSPLANNQQVSVFIIVGISLIIIAH